MAHRLTQIATRTGDDGTTGLGDGTRVAKSDLRIAALGDVDELNSTLGVILAEPLPDDIRALLAIIQHELFNLGSILATLPADVHPKQPRVTDVEVNQLEREIDAMNADLPALRSFVLPGGSRLNAELHAGRTICRRAERLVVTLARQEAVPAEAIHYLNRLSDALFVWSRWANHTLGLEEVLWQPNQSASGMQK